MVEIEASDWVRSVCWYSEVLGLTVVLEDVSHRFALLEAGPARIAVKDGGEAGVGRGAVRLTFRVADVDVERARLIGRGVAVEETVENPVEGYRAARLRDPDGTPIDLFSWTDRRGGEPGGSPSKGL